MTSMNDSRKLKPPKTTQYVSLPILDVSRTAKLVCGSIYSPLHIIHRLRGVERLHGEVSWDHKANEVCQESSKAERGQRSA